MATNKQPRFVFDDCDILTPDAFYNVAKTSEYPLYIPCEQLIITGRLKKICDNIGELTLGKSKYEYAQHHCFVSTSRERPGLCTNLLYNNTIVPNQEFSNVFNALLYKRKLLTSPGSFFTLTRLLKRDSSFANRILLNSEAATTYLYKICSSTLQAKPQTYVEALLKTSSYKRTLAEPLQILISLKSIAKLMYHVKQSKTIEYQKLLSGNREIYKLDSALHSYTSHLIRNLLNKNNKEKQKEEQESLFGEQYLVYKILAESGHNADVKLLLEQNMLEAVTEIDIQKYQQTMAIWEKLNIDNTDVANISLNIVHFRITETLNCFIVKDHVLFYDNDYLILLNLTSIDEIINKYSEHVSYIIAATLESSSDLTTTYQKMMSYLHSVTFSDELMNQFIAFQRDWDMIVRSAAASRIFEKTLDELIIVELKKYNKELFEIWRRLNNYITEHTLIKEQYSLVRILRSIPQYRFNHINLSNAHYDHLHGIEDVSDEQIDNIIRNHKKLFLHSYTKMFGIEPPSFLKQLHEYSRLQENDALLYYQTNKILPDDFWDHWTPENDMAFDDTAVEYHDVTNIDDDKQKWENPTWVTNQTHQEKREILALNDIDLCDYTKQTINDYHKEIMQLDDEKLQLYEKNDKVFVLTVKPEQKPNGRTVVMEQAKYRKVNSLIENNIRPLVLQLDGSLIATDTSQKLKIYNRICEDLGKDTTSPGVHIVVGRDFVKFGHRVPFRIQQAIYRFWGRIFNQLWFERHISKLKGTFVVIVYNGDVIYFWNEKGSDGQGLRNFPWQFMLMSMNFECNTKITKDIPDILIDQKLISATYQDDDCTKYYINFPHTVEKNVLMRKKKYASHKGAKEYIFKRGTKIIDYLTKYYKSCGLTLEPSKCAIFYDGFTHTGNIFDQHGWVRIAGKGALNGLHTPDVFVTYMRDHLDLSLNLYSTMLIDNANICHTWMLMSYITFLSLYLNTLSIGYIEPLLLAIISIVPRVRGGFGLPMDYMMIQDRNNMKSIESLYTLWVYWHITTNQLEKNIISYFFDPQYNLSTQSDFLVEPTIQPHGCSLDIDTKLTHNVLKYFPDKLKTRYEDSLMVKRKFCEEFIEKVVGAPSTLIIQCRNALPGVVDEENFLKISKSTTARGLLTTKEKQKLRYMSYIQLKNFVRNMKVNKMVSEYQLPTWENTLSSLAFDHKYPIVENLNNLPIIVTIGQPRIDVAMTSPQIVMYEDPNLTGINDITQKSKPSTFLKLNNYYPTKERIAFENAVNVYTTACEYFITNDNFICKALNNLWGKPDLRRFVNNQISGSALVNVKGLQFYPPVRSAGLQYITAYWRAVPLFTETFKNVALARLDVNIHYNTILGLVYLRGPPEAVKKIMYPITNAAFWVTPTILDLQQRSVKDNEPSNQMKYAFCYKTLDSFLNKQKPIDQTTSKVDTEISLAKTIQQIKDQFADVAYQLTYVKLNETSDQKEFNTNLGNIDDVKQEEKLDLHYRDLNNYYINAPLQTIVNADVLKARFKPTQCGNFLLKELARATSYRLNLYSPNILNDFIYNMNTTVIDLDLVKYPSWNELVPQKGEFNLFEDFVKQCECEFALTQYIDAVFQSRFLGPMPKDKVGVVSKLTTLINSHPKWWIRKLANFVLFLHNIDVRALLTNNNINQVIGYYTAWVNKYRSQYAQLRKIIEYDKLYNPNEWVNILSFSSSVLYSQTLIWQGLILAYKNIKHAFQSWKGENFDTMIPKLLEAPFIGFRLAFSRVCYKYKRFIDPNGTVTTESGPCTPVGITLSQALERFRYAKMNWQATRLEYSLEEWARTYTWFYNDMLTQINQTNQIIFKYYEPPSSNFVTWFDKMLGGSIQIPWNLSTNNIFLPIRLHEESDDEKQIDITISSANTFRKIMANKIIKINERHNVILDVIVNENTEASKTIRKHEKAFKPENIQLKTGPLVKTIGSDLKFNKRDFIDLEQGKNIQNVLTTYQENLPEAKIPETELGIQIVATHVLSDQILKTPQKIIQKTDIPNEPIDENDDFDEFAISSKKEKKKKKKTDDVNKKLKDMKDDYDM